MKKRYVWMLAALLVCVGAGAKVYPTESYRLSADGDTLLRWTGTEAEVDMGADSVLARVKYIAEKAFAQNDSIRYFGSSEGLQTIGDMAFEQCEALRAVYIGPAVSAIGQIAFFYAPSLTTFTVADSNPYYRMQGQMLIDVRNSELVASGYEESTRVVVPEGIERIGDYAFYWSDITAVTLPAGLKHIGQSAFCWAEQLTAVTLPKGVETIGEMGFYACSRLESVSLPASLQSIGPVAFGFCDVLKTMVVQSQTPPALQTKGDADVFWYTDLSSATLYVPEESIALYQQAVGWSRFGTIVGMPRPESRVLIVETLDGQKTEIRLETQPKVYNRGMELAIVSTETTITLPLSQLKRMTFRPVDETLGIGDVKASDGDDASPREMINFSQLPPRSHIDIYALDGRLLRSERVGDTSSALSLDELGRGVFLVKINGVTYKISRK